MRTATRPFKITIIALMIALSAVFEFVNRALPIRVPWGMSIDFVAVPVIIAFFILGTRYAILSGLGMALVIMALFGDFVGGTLKLVATLTMVLVMGMLTLAPFSREGPSVAYRSLPRFIAGAALALAVRCAVAAAVNYYWALPIFFSMPIENLIQTFFMGSMTGFIVFVSTMNLTQGIIDLAVSWFIVFGGRLANRASYLTRRA